MMTFLVSHIQEWCCFVLCTSDKKKEKLNEKLFPLSSLPVWMTHAGIRRNTDSITIWKVHGKKSWFLDSAPQRPQRPQRISETIKQKVFLPSLKERVNRSPPAAWDAWQKTRTPHAPLLLQHHFHRWRSVRGREGREHGDFLHPDAASLPLGCSLTLS